VVGVTRQVLPSNCTAVKDRLRSAKTSCENISLEKGRCVPWERGGLREGFTTTPISQPQHVSQCNITNQKTEHTKCMQFSAPNPGDLFGH
jgi:hypothetical protein